jgi:hypothetical protein
MYNRKKSLTKLNYLSSLLFTIISVFLYITSNVYQSVSAQDVKEEESSNDIFSDLSRNLPNFDEDMPNNNEQPLESGSPVFENPDTGRLDENNEISNGENMGESNEQGTTSETIEKSLTNGFSDSGQEPDVINEEKEDDLGSNPETSPSSRDEVINDDANNNNNNNILNPSD